MELDASRLSFFILFSSFSLNFGGVAAGPVGSVIAPNTPKVFSEGNTLRIDLLTSATGSMSANKRGDSIDRWPDGIVPFQLSAVFDDNDRKKILDAMKDFPCVRFVDRTTEADYVHISTGSGCSSVVGKKSGKQLISLQKSACIQQKGIIQHQLMHTLGFYHEQSRSDRDNFVEINWSNIGESDKNNFVIYEKVTTFGPYDFNSIMHYGKFDFAQVPNEWTIRPKPAFGDIEIGQRQGLSELDKAKISLMYNCA